MALSPLRHEARSQHLVALGAAASAAAVLLAAVGFVLAYTAVVMAG